MRILLLILLVACAGQGNVPIPYQCQQLGVDVESGDTISGEIHSYNWASISRIKVLCRSPFEQRYGCTVVHGIGENTRWSYDIYYVSDQAKAHEECHAFYEEWRHVIILEEI